MENTNTLQMQWAEICTQLEETLRDRFVMRWLSKVVPCNIENDQVNLMVTSPCIHELIEQNYLDKIQSLWKSKNTNINVVNLKLSQNNNLSECPSQKNEQLEIIQPTQKTQTYLPSEETQTMQEIPCYLDKSHTFDTFVVGKSNQFAYAAAKKIAEEDSVSFNPLYIHAGVGLGKTHLLHAIAWRIKELHPEKNVLYLSSEQFFQRFLHDLNTKNMDSFRITS